MRRHRSSQRELEFRSWGGERSGAGRKPGPRPKVARRKRAPVRDGVPMHITIRLAVRRLRSKSVHAAIRRVLRDLKRRLSSFRVLGYSVQDDHLHLIIEADSTNAFGFGVRALGIRLGKRINAALSRTGRLFADRYHRRDLETPREVRNAWAYVLLNRRRHLAKARLPVGAPVIDPFSSGGWFDGWDRPTWRDPDEPAVSRAKRWLATVGWKRWGLLAPSEIPGIRRARVRASET